MFATCERCKSQGHIRVSLVKRASCVGKRYINEPVACRKAGRTPPVSARVNSAQRVNPYTSRSGKQARARAVSFLERVSQQEPQTNTGRKMAEIYRKLASLVSSNFNSSFCHYYTSFLIAIHIFATFAEHLKNSFRIKIYK